MEEKEVVKPDFSEFLHKNGKCCICEEPLKDSKQINFAMLDKFTFWNFPGWGNVLAKDPGDRTASRALAVVCDECYHAKKRGEPVGEIRFALEVEEIHKFPGKTLTDKIIYHPVEDLRDAPSIKVREE